MRRSLMWSTMAVLTLTGCDPQAAEQIRAATEAATKLGTAVSEAQKSLNTATKGQMTLGAPAAAVVVLYNQPKDAAAFEKYYSEVHVPLVVKHQAEIGFTRAELTKIPSNLDGTPSKLYRKAELWFPSEEALKKGIATEGFKAVGGDLANFATGGLTALITVETK